MTTQLLVGELVLLLLVAVGFFLFLDLKRKKNLRASLGAMLNKITSDEAVRLEEMSGQLQTHFQLREEAAKELASQLMRDEKKFFQQFSELQLGKKESGLSGFHEQVYTLLNHYLAALPAVDVKEEAPEPSNNDDISVTPAEAEEPAEAEPSWDEAFEEAEGDEKSST
jgi:hypothetical protein